MSVLRTIGLRLLIVFVVSFDVSADDILSQLFKTEEQLAESGNAAAMYILGTMYEEGTGVEQSDEHALAWYRKAAAHGNREAEAKLFNVNIKRGTTPATKGESNNKTTLYERARANELELKLARERQAAEKARQEAEQLKAATAAQVRSIEEQRARERAEADKVKEVAERARRLAEKTNLLEEQLKREKAEAEKSRAEAEKARLEAENARLLGERLARDRNPEPFPLTSSEPVDAPSDTTATSSEFKANPCDTPAARFMSTCR